MGTIPERAPEIQSLAQAWYAPHVQAVDMLRLDLVHPVVSGNKWYKLKHNLLYALANGYTSILTFGGGYSNHLVATAAAAKEFGIHSTGIVRGVYPEMTQTLQDCTNYGMQLVFITKEEYARKNDVEYLAELSAKFGNPFIIPEGGANEWGRQGAEEIAGLIPHQYTHICMAAGTGTTLAGVRNALPAAQQVYGYAPMKNGTYLLDTLRPYLYNKDGEVKLFDEWHFGGFGKWNETLIRFMNEFYKLHHIPLDIVYTSKMMYGVKAQLQAGVFPREAKVLCIHTGGLQGNVSVSSRLAFPQKEEKNL